MIRAVVTFFDLDGPKNDGQLSVSKYAALFTLAGGVGLALGGLWLKRDASFWPGVVLAIFGLTAVFGKKHFDGLLARLTVSIGGTAAIASASSMTEAVTKTLTHTIIERRDAERGIESTGKVTPSFDDAD